jgi:hypothetical protein
MMSEQHTQSIEETEAALALAFPPEPAAEPFTGDDTATWTYWTDMDTADRGVSDEWVWERLRHRRDERLAACDWRVVPDAPWDVTPWVAYRQALRDMTACKDPRQALWPTPPTVAAVKTGEGIPRPQAVTEAL